MAVKTIVFVEGEPNSPNGDLRQGLSKLLEQKLKGELPKMILGGGKDNQGKLISQKCSKRKAIEIDHPDEELQRLTKNTPKGEYHKIKHAVELLKLLNANQLEQDFSEFKNFIDKLR